MTFSKKSFYLFVLLLVSFFSSCDDKKENKDCSEIACMTPPEFFTFNIVDQSSGENLLYNGNLDINNLDITDQITKNSIDFEIIENNDMPLIAINSIGWKTEKVNAICSVGEEILFKLNIDAEAVSENCCSFTRYHTKEISVDIGTYELVDGIYVIKR
ncbi:hypothetical protein [Aureibacter tunicatorum]|uniref:Lipoprotein n=1 Tax=Aureibacter tunicatorum TaxID=866807 RepID=A0AAE3XNI2_9BACT|nr:hypothetical protein [Aureibacter tunicatorum]MDR6239144.1 hypothetical protein [Aureibacter tunicatorum]BDD04930.1 hypothetical protein AUTU_24130 [Aureibacter tunicatorum]